MKEVKISDNVWYRLPTPILNELLVSMGIDPEKPYTSESDGSKIMVVRQDEE